MKNEGIPTNAGNLIERLREFPSSMTIDEFTMNLAYDNGFTVDIGNIITMLEAFPDNVRIVDFDILVKERSGYFQRVRNK